MAHPVAGSTCVLRQGSPSDSALAYNTMPRQAVAYLSSSTLWKFDTPTMRSFGAVRVAGRRAGGANVLLLVVLNSRWDAHGTQKKHARWCGMRSCGRWCGAVR